MTLDGSQASHRAARELLARHRSGARTRIRSSKYLNSLIEQDHRSIKLRLGPMLGFKRFRHAAIAIARVELMHRIRKGQFALSKFGAAGATAPEFWSAALTA
ncbi:DDE-type integrase/transposase/recombinase [Methylosinus sp. PW1]|uniref:DDE-type integrase/transposase/recombinase n=1 Tax=Methylosinus sp. PW1 TaxID=107636 RepID=UPI00352411DF